MVGKKMLGSVVGKMFGRKAGKGVGGAVGKVTGVAGVALKWPFLIAVAVWNLLDSIIGIFVKSPLWVFLNLILLDAIINIILIILVINMRSIFRLWIWNIILFGWAAASTLLARLAGWWAVDWIIDPILMVICCFLVALMPFDNVGGKKRTQQYSEDAYGYSEPASGGRSSGPGRKAARRDSGPTGAHNAANSGSGVTINISNDPMKRDGGG
jgi:hypothetical protein